MLPAVQYPGVFFIFVITDASFQNFKYGAHKIVIAISLLEQIIGEVAEKFFEIIVFAEYLPSIALDVNSKINGVASEFFKSKEQF